MKFFPSPASFCLKAFATIIGVVVLHAAVASAQSWTAAAPHPLLISDYAFAQDGEDLWVITGYSGGHIFNNVRRYNAATNVWKSGADIPFGSYGPAAAFFNGKIYVAHGGLFSSDQGNHFQIYDVGSNTWSAGAPRPGSLTRRAAAAAAFNGKFYLAGGQGSESTLSVYDIATNTWSAGPALPHPYRSGGYARIGQFLYLIGGTTAAFPTHSNISMRFDMATNTWSTGPAFTPQRASVALAAAGTRLFAIGGIPNGSSGASAQVDELETSTWPAGSWTPSPNNLPAPRVDHSAGFFSTGRAGGEIWITGGWVDSGSSLIASSDHLFRPVAVPCQDYNVTESTRALVPASTDIGNHCINCTTPISFPFPIRFYGTSYTSANVSSNGNLQFNSANASSANTNLRVSGFNATIFAFWDNLRTDLAGGGIFTSTTGSAPNRVFTVEWRVSNLGNTASSNFEIRFFEGSTDFEIVYGATTGTFTGTIGVQRDATGLFTQFAGPSANVPAQGTRLLFTTDCCAPIAFSGAIGSNSNTYPGSSGLQTARVFRNDIRSVCGVTKAFPGTAGTAQRTYDRYTFANPGPATCVTFEVSSACTSTQIIYPVAYLGGFNPANVATNYRGDPGSIPADGFSTFSVDVPANSTVDLVVHEVNAGTACPSYDVVVRGLSCPFQLVSAVSRKRHGTAGEFDIPLPLAEPAGVESRSASNTHQLVLRFNGAVTAGSAAVTTGNASVGAAIIAGKTITIPLSGVTDMQKVTFTVSGVTSSVGQLLPNFALRMNVLPGDTNGSGTVNATDISEVKATSGQSVHNGNFRADINASGGVNATDVSIVKSLSGSSLPAGFKEESATRSP